jgi:hypothetical protein
MTNPFAQTVPTQAPPAQQAPAGGNPFAQHAPAPAAPQQPAQQPAQQVNPYGQQQAPAYQQPAQQQAPQQPAQQPAAAPVPQLGTASAAPAPVIGGASGAQLADMYGRLVLVLPQTIEVVPRAAQYVTAEQRAAGNITQERMTATFVVLDAGPGKMDPIWFGGTSMIAPGMPGYQAHTESAPLPYVRKALWIRQTRLISQCRDYLPGGALGGPGGSPGLLVGRVHRNGPQQNDPWYLITPTEAEVGLANQYLQLVAAGQYPHPLA